MSVRDNIKRIEKEIEEILAEQGKKKTQLAGVTVLPVSKNQPDEKVLELFGAGWTVFGENRVQEVVRKHEYLMPGSIKWHLIGHLQRNKVKYLPGRVELIHSVDSLRLAEEIDDRYGRCGEKARCLVQINIAGETQKHGLSPGELGDFLAGASKLENLTVEGLMMIAPDLDDREQLRPYFREMYSLFCRYGDCGYGNVVFKILSMGMSNDYITAVEEGSNLLRLGSIIFNEEVSE